MDVTPLPTNETERQNRVRALRPLENRQDEVFEKLVQMATRYFEVPIALISIIDDNRQWFCARLGLAVSETPRRDAFCAHAVMSEQLFQVGDARLDERFCDNPLVTGEPGIRFYASVPLLTEERLALGSFCIIDSEPRPPLSARDAAMLESLAELAMLRLRNIREATFIDQPTGLYNRLRLEEDVEGALRAGQRITVVAADMIAPAFLNDIVKVLGYPFSAALMLLIKTRLQQALPEGHLLYKISPTRFGFIIHGARREAVERLSHRLADVFSAPIECEGIPLQIRFGAGILDLDPQTDNRDWLRLLVSSADNARETGVRWRYYEAALDHAQQRAFILLSSLSRAVHAEDQLRLEYQPRVDLVSGRLVGVEGLLRWRHPQLGGISPAEFIPLAERTALIRPLSLWVAERAIVQAREWQRQGWGWKVSINVSASDMDDADFVDRIIELVRSHQIDGSCLELEFTESVLMKNPEEVRRNLFRLRDQGIELAIDDFGTGYSNWSYLRDLPASSVKLDQSFMRNVQTELRDQRVVGAVIQLARQLGYRVVAEGVETEELYRLMQWWGCDEVQGYYVARPMSPEQLEEWHRSRS
ncbi:EAL domain-containing protein (putative c-di-GMP-specific phosphodiesterase class I)/GAF domain-containing protein [Pseudomonas alcaligenes]|nr:EAL domain-containing protein (putative c-di-GMP-specific phosphodiesterase class I)/GAF domain-containing protein [Pseudomonas alcaligenes]